MVSATLQVVGGTYVNCYEYPDARPILVMGGLNGSVTVYEAPEVTAKDARRFAEEFLSAAKRYAHEVERLHPEPPSE